MGTTDFSVHNKDYKHTDLESTNIEFASKDKSATPMLPEIQSLKSSTERQNSMMSSQSSRHAKNLNIVHKHRRKETHKYHKDIFDNYEPLKFNLETGEWIRTDIVRNTRFINIERDLKDRMRAKGRFPIPDPIRKTKDHPKNDENLILRADSLIESAYNTEKGDEFVKNEDFIIPGILSPLQSEISMHKVDLYSSSENDDNTYRSTLRHDKDTLDISPRKRKDSLMSGVSHKFSMISRKNTEMSRKNSDATPKIAEAKNNVINQEILDNTPDSQKHDGKLTARQDEDKKQIIEKSNEKNDINQTSELNQDLTQDFASFDHSKFHEVNFKDTLISKDMKDDKSINTSAAPTPLPFAPGISIEQGITNSIKGDFLSQLSFKVKRLQFLSTMNIENIDAIIEFSHKMAIEHKYELDRATIEGIFQQYCKEFGVTPIKIYSYLVQGQKLILHKYKLSLGITRALACILPYFTKLEQISLSDNTLDDNGLTVIVKAIKYLKNFRSLKIMRNRPRKLFMTTLYQTIYTRSKVLKNLNLSGCATINSQFGNLMKILNRLLDLQSLNLSDIKLDVSAIQHLSNYVRKNETITKLTMRNCSLMTQKAYQFILALIKNDSI